MKVSPKTSIAVTALVIVGFIAFWLYRQDVTHHGRTFPNRSRMGYQFAIDYLRNIENDPNYTAEKRELTIDIETEITDLCQLELTEEAAGNYDPTALLKYRNEVEE